MERKSIPLLAMNTFSEYLIECLRQRGWSRTDFAHALKTTQSVVSRYTTGVRPPPMDRLDLWIELLRLGPDDAETFRRLALQAHAPDKVMAQIKELEATIAKLKSDYSALQDDYVALSRRVLAAEEPRRYDAKR